MTPSPASSSANAWLATIAAYAIWGVAPIYFKAVREVNPLELLGHRAVFSFITLGALLLAQHRLHLVGRALRDAKTRSLLIGSTATILLNWLTYIWAVNAKRLLEASLGYFIGPLVTVAIGLVIFKERLSRTQLVAILLATVAVGYLILQVHGLQWIALTLAVSFSIYSALRKVAKVDAVVGLFIEVMFALPAALGVIIYLELNGTASFLNSGLLIDVLLMSAGLVTSVPLLLFVYGAQRLPLSAIGLVQYLAPSGQFLLAVFLYQEPFGKHHQIAFAIIWAALLIFTAGTVRKKGYFSGR